MPSFEYEPLILSPKLETSYEEEDKGDIDGARPSNIKVVEQVGDLRGGKDNPKKEATKQIIELVKFILQEVNCQEYVFATIEIGEQMQHEEHIIQKDQQGQIELMSKLQQLDQTHITSNQQLQVVLKLQQ